MLLGISGTAGSGRHEAIKYFVDQGFELLQYGESIQSVDDLIAYVTPRWRQNFVALIEAFDQVIAAEHRPFFLHLTLDAPMGLRFQRSKSKSLEQFVEASDKRVFQENGARIFCRAHVALINDFETTAELQKALKSLDIENPTRMRPDWDAYFMTIANLAAQRSNCMKRRVGCVVVRDFRVVSTGYNGTPRGVPNCNQGGCKRCNSAQGSGAGLDTCLCLHAEENALLEAGRDRLGANSSLYCNTCPCLTCSIKIIQSGITEVVYSQKYSMDEQAEAIFKASGVKLRQYHPPQQGLASI